MDNSKISRRELLGGATKLAYVAPALTLLSMVASNTAVASLLPPCSPFEDPPGCIEPLGNSPSSQSPSPQSGRKPPHG